MQKKRLFVAMPLSHSMAYSVKRISTELEEKFNDFTDRQIHFVPQENWHITVTFLGDQDDIALPAIADAMKATSRNFTPPEIVLEKISYGPALLARRQKGGARMIWLCASHASSERIAKIKNVLDAALASRGVPFQREMKLFSGHITLARFAEETEIASLPQIERPLQFSFPAASLDLVESELKRSGAKYGMLQNFAFKE